MSCIECHVQGLRRVQLYIEYFWQQWRNLGNMPFQNLPTSGADTTGSEGLVNLNL